MSDYLNRFDVSGQYGLPKKSNLYGLPDYSYTPPKTYITGRDMANDMVNGHLPSNIPGFRSG